MPKTWVTPQATIVSIIRSVTVRTWAGSGGTATQTPSSRTSTGKVSAPSSCPPGESPVSGQ